MADINSTALSLLNGLNSDGKLRSSMDFSMGGDDLSSGQFMDVMSASLSAISSDDDNNAVAAPKANSTAYAVSAKSDVKYSYNTTTAPAAAKETAQAKQAVIDRADVKEKIKAKLKEIAAKNDMPVKDTKALKALQKVANFLIKANEDGKVSLPAAMVQKLKDFVAKGDDLNAADITQFMSDFSDLFKQIIIPMPAQPAATPAVPATDASASTDTVAATDNDKDLKWPSDILDALKDAGLQVSANDAAKPLTIIDVLRTVKTLVNESEKSAIQTLDDKSKEAALLPQDQASILLVGNATNTVKTDNAPKAVSDDATPAVAAAAAAPVAEPAQAAPQAAAPVADDASVKKAIKELQKGMEQAVQNQNAKPADNAAKAPAADTGKIVADPFKALNAVKSQPTVSSLDLSASVSAPAPKAPVKAEEPSLTKISLDAQAPNHNNDKSFNDSQRENNSRTEAAQVKTNNVANLAASVAAPSVSDIKVAAADLPVDQISAPAITANGINALADNAKVAAKITQAAATAASLPSAATQQVIAQIVAKGDKATQISVNLTPVELGQVEVRLNIQKDGSVHTVVTVDKPETLALLQKDSAQLERSLQQAGLDANAKNMSFNLRDGNQAQQFNQGRKRFSRSDIGTTVTEVAVNIAPEGQIITDNRVNYHA